MRRLAAVTIATALVLGLPAGALAQSGSTNPFSPGAPALPTQTQTATTPTVITPTTTTAGSGSLSSGSVAAIAIGAIVLLVGISLFIWRDARRRAPIRHYGPGTSHDDPRAATRHRAKPRKLSPAERRRRKRGRAR